MCKPCDCPRCQGVRSSDAFVMVFTANGSVASIDTTLLGLAVTLDKPIIVVCPPGSKIPDKLAKVVDRFIELNTDAEQEQIVQAVKEALLELGVITDRGPRPPYDTEPSHN